MIIEFTALIEKILQLIFILNDKKFKILLLLLNKNIFHTPKFYSNGQKVAVFAVNVLFPNKTTNCQVK